MNSTLRALLWIGAGLTLAATVAALALLWWLVGGAQGHFGLQLDGDPLMWRGWLHHWDWQPAWAAVAGLVVAVLMLLAFPAVFLLALLASALFGALGVAGVLLAVAMMAALALSPLWLAVLVLWLLLRRRRASGSVAAP
jgi:hypothetical protein